MSGVRRGVNLTMGDSESLFNKGIFEQRHEERETEV